MKKNGFTLAEVLITLAIIGVVATMTLPGLIANTGEQQYKTGLRKGINTLTESAQMNQSLSGFAYDTIQGTELANDAGVEGAMSLGALLANRAAVDFTKTGNADFDIENENGNATDAFHTIANPTFVHFRDGSTLIYDSDIQATAENTAIQADRLPLGFVVAYDTNGTKGPNILSNCDAQGLGADESREAIADDMFYEQGSLDDACTPDRRVIRDQFLLRLRGTVVEPEGAAAMWAMEN